MRLGLDILLLDLLLEALDLTSSDSITYSGSHWLVAVSVIIVGADRLAAVSIACVVPLGVKRLVGADRLAAVSVAAVAIMYLGSNRLVVGSVTIVGANRFAAGSDT